MAKKLKYTMLVNVKQDITPGLSCTFCHLKRTSAAMIGIDNENILYLFCSSSCYNMWIMKDLC